MTLSPGRYPQLPADEYFALPAANASSLKAIRKSAAHMLAPRRESRAFDVGHAVHALVLEGLDAWRERHAIRPREFRDYRSKDAREWRDEQLAAGMTVLTWDDAELVKRIARNVSEHPAAVALLEASKPRHECRELTYVWEDETHRVPCKCRFDLVADADIGADLKTAVSAHHDEFARNAIRYGYDLQFAHYREGFRAVEGRDLAAFMAIVVETEEPYGVAVYHITDEWLERGLWQRELAMADWADWYAAGMPTDVPPYHQFVTELPLPRWA